MAKTDAGAPNGSTIPLPDGRRLGYVEYGQATGPALLYFHGHPGSRLEARFLADAAMQAGIRLVGVDRPGRGRSSYQPRRRLLDWPADVAALADALHLDHFAVVGFSGGGPYALACASRLAERVTACGVVAGVGRVGPGLAFLARWAPWVLLPLTRRLFRFGLRLQRHHGRLPAGQSVVPGLGGDYLFRRAPGGPGGGPRAGRAPDGLGGPARRLGLHAGEPADPGSAGGRGDRALAP